MVCVDFKETSKMKGSERVEVRQDCADFEVRGEMRGDRGSESRGLRENRGVTLKIAQTIDLPLPLPRS